MVAFLLIAFACAVLVGVVTFGGHARSALARRREVRRCLSSGWWDRLLADLREYEQQQAHRRGNRRPGR